MGLLDGKVAVVTGAGSGIGRAIALAFVREGANVLVADVDEDGGEDTVRQADGHPGEAAFAACDTSQAAQVERVLNDAAQRWGGLHILVNNAGIIGPETTIADTSLDDWQQVIDINLSGVFYGMKYAIPHMLRGGGGAIVNTSSILGQVGSPKLVAYVASKHGVAGMTRTAAIEYSAQGIRVNAVAPGSIGTPLVASMDEEMQQASLDAHPIGRLGEPEEVAALVLFLASDQASFITGGFYTIDGGYTAQ